jgi:hypothetical protein
MAEKGRNPGTKEGFDVNVLDAFRAGNIGKEKNEAEGPSDLLLKFDSNVKLILTIRKNHSISQSIKFFRSKPTPKLKKLRIRKRKRTI